MTEVSSKTLRILHLPPTLTDERRDELLKKFNAIKTKTIRKSPKFTITFAEFFSKEIATEAFLRLHQLEVKGHRLSIEFAKKSIDSDYTKTDCGKKADEQEVKKETTEKVHLENFLKKLNSWTGSNAFTQPPNPNITYKYPAPTRETLLRIAIQLIKEPMFYTQVLHLMNRMNLPPPFEEMELNFPLVKESYNVEQYKNIFGLEEQTSRNLEQEADELEESESEIESEEEPSGKIQNIIPMKRKRPSSSKRLKIPKFVNPKKQLATASTSNQRPLRPEDLFESVNKNEPKKLELKISGNMPSSESTSFHVSDVQEGGFGLFSPANKNDGKISEDRENSQEKEQEFITSEELANNRITVKDYDKFTAFKNYHPGKASCRLYIKNLAKQVEIKDLHFIYKKYVIEDLVTAENQYSVQLMQGGRMKGQAFVTLQNIKQTEIALAETNGFILKDKPMVVQFSKAVQT